MSFHPCLHPIPTILPPFKHSTRQNRNILPLFRHFPQKSLKRECALCGLKNDAPLVQTACHHSAHIECLLPALHLGNVSCNHCHHSVIPSSLNLFHWIVETRADPSGPSHLAQTRRDHSWFNVTISLVPPPGLKITLLRILFHPAFSFSYIDFLHPPFKLVVKIFTEHVPLLYDIWYTKEGLNERSYRFTLLHDIQFRNTVSHYYHSVYNGLPTSLLHFQSQNFDPQLYFTPLLSEYHRPPSFYQASFHQTEPLPAHLIPNVVDDSEEAENTNRRPSPDLHQNGSESVHMSSPSREVINPLFSPKELEEQKENSYF
ncbi:hypothetical protein BLNAU_19973 [Blattamonas nauphoetae]|uniref:RING-type domain-containing protein n=1 Tax=Blattamonas nauphoetae TaxID=2049346 RepID=A0ABQ9X039_9EUKA|nr:hypothetical protein BLNAU_19973 [Blattamonas nauphoetae]